jgi:NAD(P)H-hydrate epimerase
MALLRRLDCPVAPAAPDDDLPAADLLLDALVGYGLDGPPDEDLAALIHRAIWHGAPALSLDVPSGLDATTGVPSQTTVHAEATLTLALPKCGLDAPAAQSAVGDLYLADIGIPPSLYDALDLRDDVTGLFGERDLLRLR